MKLTFRIAFICAVFLAATKHVQTLVGDAYAKPAGAQRGSTYYVSGAGSDSNSGTFRLPFLTIQRAANLVTPGDTVIVEDGTYSDVAAFGRTSTLVNVTRGGTTGNYVTFRSQNRWGAVLDGLNTTAEGWEIGANYVRIQGFEIKGFRDTGISNYRGGEFADIAQNHIHDVGRYCTDTPIGRDGIYLSKRGAVVQRNLVHDIGRYSPGENGCMVTTKNYENHDHCVYLNAGADDTTIENNIIYNCKHGWGVHILGVIANTLILNNTFAFPNRYKDAQIIVFAPVTGLEIENNIFYQPTGAAIRFQDYTYSNVIVKNNMTDQSAIYELDSSDGGIIREHIPSGVTFANNMDHTNPLFISPAIDNFCLRKGSPGIDSGLTLGNVKDDYAGTTRPQGAGYDIGAYELVQPPPH